MPPVHPMVNGRPTQAMIRSAQERAPDMYEVPDEPTGIWTDPRLGDKASSIAFDRPCRTPHEMDQAMMDAWSRRSGAAR